MTLYWLPKHPDFNAALREWDAAADPQNRLASLRSLASYDLDFVQTSALDKRLARLTASHNLTPSGLTTLRLALLSSSTIDQLIPSIRVAALRRGILVTVYLAPYNLYRQQLLDSSSELFNFHPEVVLLALDAYSGMPELPLQASAEEVRQAVQERCQELESLWDIAAKQLGSMVIQQSVVIPPQQIFGHMDAMQPATPEAFFHQLNDALRMRAAERHVVILDAEHLASQVGKDDWCQRTLWFHGKQAISPAHAPLYGDHVARLLASLRGLSYKCLVLDLDNTLWGGVIGDEGLEGIDIGEGSGPGEAFLHFQAYLKRLRERGILLAVCSKNDRANAEKPFLDHPDMRLQLGDFAAFIANWDHKAGNLELIAKQLNIGLDSLVFFDDNPAEQKLVRQFLPMVAVPNVPEDSAHYAQLLSDAGYFEAIAFTADDQQRASGYAANDQRAQLQEQYHDMDSFLAGLKMSMEVRPFDGVGRARIAQLINKSNQFNLTTRRYTEAQIQEFEKQPEVVTFQVRLQDSCGDNGMISVLIAKPATGAPPSTLLIDTWLMSCRVLGRKVEQEVLNLLVDIAKRRGYRRLRGEYIATAKNGLVRDHYKTLGFQSIEKRPEGSQTEHSIWDLDLDRFIPHPTPIASHYLEDAHDRTI